MSICTLAEAKRNLKSLKRHHTEIDDTNPEQVQCYIMLRRTVSKVFPEKFLLADGGVALAGGGVALADGGDCACRRRRLSICTLAEAKLLA